MHGQITIASCFCLLSDFATKVECQLAIDSFDSINEVDMVGRTKFLSRILHLRRLDGKQNTHRIFLKFLDFVSLSINYYLVV